MVKGTGCSVNEMLGGMVANRFGSKHRPVTPTCHTDLSHPKLSRPVKKIMMPKEVINIDLEMEDGK